MNKEFYQHFGDVRTANPTINLRQAFEGWAIQKISSLLVLVMVLPEQIRMLGEQIYHGR